MTDIVFEKKKTLPEELRELLEELEEERKTITDFDLEIVYASFTYRLKSILGDFD
ncbi:hypothetical protein [Ureibacillus acetophenoni]|uniref:hypothetical protein n=1 Tax=Ureibacillus acetophenoni TaxID=614649 RepID=UPI0014834204|nr:hypothetical protein [Ureibacillus acetophenoni]